MAEATGLRNNALPYPVYGAPYAVVVPIFDADGDFVTGAAGLDSEVSKNGDTFADCTNEATEIATNSGMYYLSLTGAEMTADVVAAIIKTSTAGAKTTPVVLYPRKLVPIRTGTSAGGDTAYITLDASASGLDDFYNGMLCVATIDGNVEARIITDYTGSNQRAAVTPAWNVAPDADDTFIVYLPEGPQVHQANVTLWNGAAAPAMTGDAYARLGAPAGASVSADVAAVKADTAAVKTKTDYLPSATAGAAGGVFIAGANAATTVNITGNLSGSVGSVSGAVGSVTGNVGGNVTGSVGSVAAGGITAASIATGAIDADALAADAVDEILDEVVEGSTTWRQAIRLLLAALVGKVSGGGTTTVTFRDLADAKNRITATVDSNGNRSAISLDAS